MNYDKKSVRDINVEGKRVLLRCDFNVPMDKKTGVITDDTRIRAALPTIKYLLERGARVTACSHLGKPKGERKPELSLEPVAKRLSKLLGKNVAFVDDVAGEAAQKASAELKPGEILLLQNTRFEKGEEKNDPELSRALANMGDVFVSDAFGTVHRAHASTVGVAAFLPAVSGLLIETELDIMGGALNDPVHPFTAILGGAKVSDKIGVIRNLLTKADSILIGGGMAYTFIKAMGHEIGASLCEDDKLDYAREMIAEAQERGVKLLLPSDAVVGDRFEADCDCKTVAIDAIPEGWMGLDIGPETAKTFAGVIAKSRTVIWNGPMGVFEFKRFAEGTKAVAKAIATSKTISVVGGGDSAAAVEQLGYADRISHISTGGGASLEFLEGRELPGVACLEDR